MNASDFDKSILQRMSDQALCATYLQTNKDSFCNIFGHNARIYGNLVVEELTSRGIKQIPNIRPNYDSLVRRDTMGVRALTKLPVIC